MRAVRAARERRVSVRLPQTRSRAARRRAQVAAKYPPPDAEEFGRWFPGLDRCARQRTGGAHSERALTHLPRRAAGAGARRAAPRRACACCASPTRATRRTSSPTRGWARAAWPCCWSGAAPTAWRCWRRSCRAAARAPRSLSWRTLRRATRAGCCVARNSLFSRMSTRRADSRGARGASAGHAPVGGALLRHRPLGGHLAGVRNAGAGARAGAANAAKGARALRGQAAQRDARLTRGHRARRCSSPAFRRRTCRCRSGRGWCVARRFVRPV